MASKKGKAKESVRSIAMKESWKNPKIAKSRSARYPVKVNKVTYRSVTAAFGDLGIDVRQAIPFRKRLVDSASGRAKFEGHTFTLA